MFQMDKLKTILFEMKKKPFFVPLVFIVLGMVLISLFSFETECVMLFLVLGVEEQYSGTV